MYFYTGIFVGVPSLEHLDVSDNNLKRISRDTFIGIENNLNSLFLNNNNFTHLPEDVFSRLCNLHMVRFVY